VRPHAALFTGAPDAGKIFCSLEAHLFMEAYFFSASASTFLHAGVSLSFDLARQAMILPPPGVVPLQNFS
jgi:hypothetical protein